MVYVRNSTEMQIGNSREEFQRDNGLALAHQHGFVKVEVKADLGISGEEVQNRPQYQQLLAEIEAGLVGAVIVADISRLSRDKHYVDGFQLFSICAATHTVIITPTVTYDPDVEESANMLAFQLMGARMQKQLNNTALMQGMVKSAQKGTMFTGNVPIGYDRQPMPLDKASPKPRTWFVVNPAEAQLVELAFQLAETMGTRRVAIALNEQGHRFPIKSLKKQLTIGRNHNSPTPMTERTWNASDVLRVLKQPLYGGLYVWAGRRRDSDYFKGLDQPIEVPMARLRIIPEARWQAMQALLRSRNREVMPPRAATSPYLFSGVLKCLECGSPMKGARTRSSKQQRIYRCVGHAEGQPCRGNTVREAVVRRAVRDNLLTVVPALRIDSAIREAVTDKLGQQRSESAIAALDAEAMRLEEAQLKAMNLHYDGLLNQSEIRAELGRITQERRQIERKRDAERSRQRNRITVVQLREYMGADLRVWVRALKGQRLSRVTKLVYKSFRVSGTGRSHKRQGRLTAIVLADDVKQLLPKSMQKRSKGIESTASTAQPSTFMPLTAH